MPHTRVAADDAFEIIPYARVLAKKGIAPSGPDFKPTHPAAAATPGGKGRPLARFAS